MALFKPMMGNSSALDLQEKQAGYAWFCVDDGSFHIDYVDTDGNLQRKPINYSMNIRLEALEKFINNSPLINGYDGFDAGTIDDVITSEFDVIDAGNIVYVVEAI